MSKYGDFSGPYFPVFGLNMEISEVNLRIQSKYEKITTRKNFVFELFSRSAIYTHLFVLIYTYLSILTFSVYYYTNSIKLMKHGKYRNYDEIF